MEALEEAELRTVVPEAEQEVAGTLEVQERTTS